MNFANYADFRSAVIRMIDGDDVSTSLHTDTIDLLIALGESRVYHGDDAVSGLRTRDMEAPLSLAVTGNTATLPTDCIEIKRVQFSGEPPLEYLPPDDLLTRLENGGGGQPRYYTLVGSTLTFYPAASGTVSGRYFARLFDIKTGTNALFNRYPECFLFAALAEAAPFIGEDARLPMWKALWAGWMNSASRTERLQASAGSPLTARTR